ncbi:hypothetical protein RM780_24205 [Streptomyces sp. DSM 44917]|uniref:Uncharacterized protein n=1 Tax=Streptomyces boetiae TaxID=3075541 RepID=A0ABU2LFJ7_9ACTN|nr:hypothetical protein [Streptomyces sp. DSM 44917]MDT0310033.1 hypothetical protein [Streptomyces sp. DSM 44917]
MREEGAAAVAVPVTVDAKTVRCGDQILVGGQLFTVRDMVALPRGGRRLEFTSGEHFALRAETVLWATRLIRPAHRGGPRWAFRARRGA